MFILFAASLSFCLKGDRRGFINFINIRCDIGRNLNKLHISKQVELQTFKLFLVNCKFTKPSGLY